MTSSEILATALDDTTRLCRKPLCRFMGVLVASFCLAAGIGQDAQAQSPNVERAQALIWNQSSKDNAAVGRELLEAATLSGDVDARRILGEHLVYGWVFPQDPQRGLSLLTEAAEAGDVLAKTRLGEVLLNGAAGVVDPLRAREFLEAASAENEPEALRQFGEQLIYAQHFSKDVPAGVELLERAVSLGNPNAMVSLGALYLETDELGRDRAKALKLFEAAAALGNGEGLAKYGAYLMWGEVNAVVAEDTLNRAGELGVVKAYASLAQGAMYGYLGGGSVSRAKYADYAAKAREAETEEIAVFEAERKLWGIGGRASGPEAIAILTQAADQGNRKAAKYLIALLRDGNNLNVRRSVSQAQAALDKYAPILSHQEQAQYALTLDAAKARTPQAYAEVLKGFAAQPDLHSEWLGKETYKANPNVAMYILQDKLKGQGLYAGVMHGFATRETLAAIYDACSATLNRDLCNDSVMRADVIGPLMVRK